MSVLNKLSIGRKLAIAFAGMFVIGTAAAGVGILQLATIEESSAATKHEVETGVYLRGVLDSFAAQESAIRGLLLSGDPAYVEHYEAAVEDYGLSLGLVGDAMSADGEAAAAQLAAINDIVARWQNEVAARQIELMREPLTIDEARAIEVSGASAQAMNEVRGIYDQLLAEQEAELAQRATEEATAFSTAYSVLIAGGILSLVAAAGFGVVANRNMSQPIARMSGQMRELADGNLEVAIEGLDRQDELGDMAAAMQVFKENAERNRELSAAAEKETAERNARAKRLSELTEGFSRDVGKVLDQVTAAARQLEGTSGSLTSTAQETSGRAANVASASEEASHNVETVAAASEELGASIEEISRQVMRQRELAVEAANDAKSSDTEVRRLAESAQKIGDVVSLITDIAEQTNLLALNATIEAARAGEAGKGFAVVASEVKNLASQTAKATEQISNDIQAIQAQTSSTVNAIEVIGQRIGSISEIATAVASAVEEQSAATKEISRNVQEAAAGARDVATNISGVTDSVGGLDRSSNELAEASQILTGQAEELQNFVSSFVNDVRVA
jgi:methyl-accepting chemotaxis protein